MSSVAERQERITRIALTGARSAEPRAPALSALSYSLGPGAGERYPLTWLELWQRAEDRRMPVRIDGRP